MKNKKKNKLSLFTFGLAFVALVLSGYCCIELKRSTEAIKDAKEQIESFTKVQIKEVGETIHAMVNDTIIKANTKLSTAIDDALNKLQEKANKKFEDDIKKNIQPRIIFSIVVSIIALIIAVILLISKIKNSLKEQESIEDRISQSILYKFSNNQNVINTINEICKRKLQSRDMSNGLTEKRVREIISEYMSKKPESQSHDSRVRDVSPSQVVSSNNTSQEIRKEENNKQPVQKFYLYGRDSRSMSLNYVQNEYQQGKTLYKLTLDDSESNTAAITLCIERDEVKQRILRQDKKYLEPICIVTKNTDEPTMIEITKTGTAERVDNVWEVKSPINVIIK